MESPHKRITKLTPNYLFWNSTSYSTDKVPWVIDSQWTRQYYTKYHILIAKEPFDITNHTDSWY